MVKYRGKVLVGGPVILRFRSPGVFLSGFVAILILLLVAPRPFLSAPVDHAATRQILVLSGPIHTDIAIPIDDDLRRDFAFLPAAGVDTGRPDARYLIVGWGGRAFYTETPQWADLKPVPVLKALTVDRSVLHFDLGGPIDPSHSSVTPVLMDDAGHARLVAFILGTLATDSGGPQVIAGVAYGATDAFFEAKGAFNLFVGCNSWTARAMREAGLRTGWWTPLPVALQFALGVYNERVL